MSFRCQISKKGALVGNNVSHANNKTKKRQQPNLLNKSFYSQSLKRKLRIRISHRTLRTIDKLGLEQVLKKNGMTVRDLI